MDAERLVGERLRRGRVEEDPRAVTLHDFVALGGIVGVRDRQLEVAGNLFGSDSDRADLLQGVDGVCSDLQQYATL